MAKVKSVFVCQSCGNSHPRWVGKCEACGEWNSVVEETPVVTAFTGSKAARNTGRGAEVVNLNAQLEDAPRLGTGSAELDRVLGGGLVPGSAILIGGDPGIGKSTLLLQAAAALSAKTPVIYFSGEESASQVQMRARRMGVEKANVQLATTGHLETIMSTISQQKPGMVIIDSIQTVHSDQADAAPGTVSQVRLAAHNLISTAKSSGTAVVFVGHVTKDGQIAGPRVLEHMVDTVMYFEGDRGNTFRVLRAFKNRFGATNEIGVFDMRQQGLVDVTNPSALFLAERPQDAAGSAVLAAIEGTRPVLIEVQALVSSSNLAQPRRTTLGIDSNRLAMIAAVLDKHAGFSFANHDIFLNITGGMRVVEPAADLAIAAALISSLLDKPLPADRVIFGELGLAGEVRSVNQMEMRLREASKLGFASALTPQLAKNTEKGGLAVASIRRLTDMIENLYA